MHSTHRRQRVVTVGTVFILNHRLGRRGGLTRRCTRDSAVSIMARRSNHGPMAAGQQMDRTSAPGERRGLRGAQDARCIAVSRRGEKGRGSVQEGTEERGEAQGEAWSAEEIRCLLLLGWQRHGHGVRSSTPVRAAKVSELLPATGRAHLLWRNVKTRRTDVVCGPG